MSKQTRSIPIPEENFDEEVVTASPPDDGLDEQPLTVKKKESTLVSGPASTEPGKPSKPSSEKSTSTGNEPLTDTSFFGTLKWAAKDIAKSYKTPKDKTSKEPISPIENAFMRGRKTAETANIIGLTNEKPTPEKIEQVAKLQKETEEYPSSSSYQAINSAKSFKEAATIFVSDPIQIIAEATVESMTAMAAHGASRVATGAAMGSVVPGGTGAGAIAGMAETSLGLEFAGDFMETLQEAGVDTKDPVALQKAFEDDDLIANARAHAWKKGIPVAIFDLISGGLAGKIVAKPAKSLLHKTAQGAAELLVQGGFGATGEAVSQKVAGEDLKPGEILVEGLAEFAGAPVEATIGATTFNKPSPTETVNAVTKNVTITNEPELDAKATIIQKTVEANEAAVNAGQQDAPVTTTLTDDQKTQAAPTEPVKGTVQEGPVSEDIQEEALSPQGEPQVQEQPEQQPVESQPETLQTPEEEPAPKTAKEQIDDLVESGDLQRDAENRVTIKTDKGGTELKRILEENKIKHKPVEKEATTEQPVAEPTQESEMPFTKTVRGPAETGGVKGVQPFNQFKLNQGPGFSPVRIVLTDDQSDLYQKGTKANKQTSAKTKPENQEAIAFADRVNELARQNRDPNKEVVLDLRPTKNAIQKQSPNALDVRQQTGDGGTLAAGDTGQQEIAQASTPQEEGQKQVTTPEDVHAAAKAAGIDFESPEFMKSSKDVTGKKHLDDMTPDELDQMVKYIEAAEPPKTPPPVETGSIALDQPEEKKVSGIKKALVPEGKVETTPIEKRSMEQMLTNAKEQVDSGDLNPKAIVDEIAQGNARALQPDEVAGLVYYKTQLDNKLDQLNADLIAAIEANDVRAQAQLRPQIDAINQEIDAYHTMALKTAYEQSLAFNMRKMLLDNEYNLQSQINKYKASNNGQISEEVEAKFKKLDEELKAANARIKVLEEQKTKTAATAAMGDIRQDLQRQREQRKAAAKSRKDKINDFFNSLKAKTDPNKLNSITQVIGEAVFNGAIDAIRIAVLAGSDVATAVQAGIDYVNEHYRGNDFDEKLFRSIVQPGLEKIMPPEQDIKGAEMRDNKLYLPQAMIRQYVEDGVTDINDLVKKIQADIQEEFPDVTEREIRDAITRYGETRTLSKGEIEVQLREMKRLGRLISSLEDVQNKKRPLRSGLQRDKLTDEERRLQRQIKEEMKNLPVDEEEEAKSWKNALDAVKSRLRNHIADLENQIRTGEKTAKKTGIAYDEEANALKAQRDKLKAIIEAIEGKPKMSDEQRTRLAVAAVERSIADLENRLKDKNVAPKERTTTKETPALKALRDQRTELQKQYRQMEQDLGVADKKKLEAAKAGVKRSIENLENRIKTGDFQPKKRTPIQGDEELTKLKLERDKIKQQFDLEKEKIRLKNRPWNEKVWDTFIDLWNIPKSLLASIDMSAPFRQGALLSVANPGASVRSFKEMFSQAFSNRKANEWLLKLRDSPLYPIIKQSKLYVSEPNTKLTAKEENFMSNFASRIPIAGPLVKASERAYVAYLNKLRVDVFANGMDRLREQGITPESNPEAYKQWASFINNATGRGNLGALELAAPVLNGLFFSPRYIISRFNLLNPVTYAKMPAPVRRMALKNAIAYIAFTTLFVGLLGAAFPDDLDVEWDPRSTDFGKLRLGNTRFDFYAGFQQVVRLLAQLATGQRKTKTGEIAALDGRSFPFETRGSIALNFLRSKLSPTASTVANVLSGKTVVGEDVTLKSELLKNITPLYMQDMAGIYQEEGPTGLVTTLVPSFFGVGVQNYSGNSGLKNKEFDPNNSIHKLNKDRKYSISQPSKFDLSKSFGQDVDDDTFEKFNIIRDKEIARLFSRNKLKLERATDIAVYDRLMDNIIREASREAKYRIAREKRWDTSNFDSNGGFLLKNYKKDKDGKVVEK